MTQDELRRKCLNEAVKICDTVGCNDGCDACAFLEVRITEALLQKEMEIERLKNPLDNSERDLRSARHDRQCAIDLLKAEKEKVKSLQMEIERLKNELRSPIRLSEKLLKPLTEEKDEWKNRAVKHAEENLLLKEEIRKVQQSICGSKYSLVKQVENQQKEIKSLQEKLRVASEIISRVDSYNSVEVILKAKEWLEKNQSA